MYDKRMQDARDELESLREAEIHSRICRGALQEVKRALEKYEEAVDNSPLTVESKKTYKEHPKNFVRWLEGEFEPGGSLS